MAHVKHAVEQALASVNVAEQAKTEGDRAKEDRYHLDDADQQEN